MTQDAESSSAAVGGPPVSIGQVHIANNDKGFTRDPRAQALFDKAVQSLKDGQPQTVLPRWKNLADNQLRCDLALEGGGVKGIGLVGAIMVLDEAGLQVQRVAGTSAGAIAAALVASIVQKAHVDGTEPDMSYLRKAIDTVSFTEFMPMSFAHRLFMKIGRGPGNDAWMALKLMRSTGLYSGDYLKTWLGSKLAPLNITDFASLSIDDDPDISLPPERRYRLVVHTSDITRGQLVRLPWDGGYYFKKPESMAIVDAVRASMSIPFFFKPVEVTTDDVSVPTSSPDGQMANEVYAKGTVSWVDGGMLENFPITAFDRIDGQSPRWPTIGLKLSSFAESYPPTKSCKKTFSEAKACLKTMMNEWDRYSIEQEYAAQTIFINPCGVATTDFDLTKQQQDDLFLSGVLAATNYIIEIGPLGHVPTSAAETEYFVGLRKRLDLSERARVLQQTTGQHGT
ncbi:MAG: patatin-like phospholipase family protein [Acidimicrobiales bacterium]